MAQPLCEWHADDLLRAYQTGEVSPVEVTQAVLDRAAQWEPHIHATYAMDAAAALAQAQASEARWRAKAPQGRLDGVPVTLKENIRTQGVPTPMGSAATPLAPSPDDAPAAARLREAGAVIVSKTTMPDFGFLPASASSFHGITRNPWDLSLNTGGSSSGAGAAVAAGYGPLHLGTDIGGSVRIPAAFCGAVGFKPSQGRVPVDPPANARCIGPLTRTVADTARLMQEIAQPDARDYLSLPPADIAWLDLAQSVKGLRIGLWTAPNAAWTVDAEILAAVQAAARIFEQAGAIVEPLADFVAPEMRQGMSGFFCMRARVELQAMGPERAAKTARYYQQAGEYAARMTPEDSFRAFGLCQAMAEVTVKATQPFDFVLSPTTASLPFAADAIRSDKQNPGRDPHFTSVFNQSGQPAVSINCGYSQAGLPMGLQIAGRRFDDLGVLHMARFWEQACPTPTRWPGLPA